MRISAAGALCCAYLAGAMFLAACGGEGAEADFEGISSTASELISIQGSACVDLLAGQTIVVGSVCSVVEGENLKLTYTTTGGWMIHETQLWAGLALADMPQTRTGNPKVGNFPHNATMSSGVSSYSVFVPLSTFGLSSSMTVCDPKVGYLVAHAVVKRQLADGTVESQTAYGEGQRLVAKGNWATWFSTTLTCSAPLPELGSCETAFAKSPTSSTCFIGSPLLDSKRWGWTNGPIGPGNYSFDIYAGAGQCSLSKGTRVGALRVAYDGRSATVSYQMNAGSFLDETHLYIGAEPLPRDVNGDYTVAPGQYGNIHQLKAASADQFTVGGLSGNVYVVAHASVCSSI